MNRAERRRQERADKKKTATVNMTAEQIEQLKMQITEIAIKDLFGVMLAIPILVLRDKYGFGKKRLNKFADEVQKVWDAYMNDYLTPDDIWQVLEEEIGMTKERVNGKDL